MAIAALKLLRTAGLIRLAVLIGLSWNVAGNAWAQLTVLSAGDAEAKWRQTQMESIDRQLSTADLPPELRLELQAQKRWLENWKPKSLGLEPLWDTSQEVDEWTEPILDPAGVAGGVRRRLFGKAAVPTPKDTQALRQLLDEHPDDVGVRQLHLHWIDQRQYRKQYAEDIAAAATKLDGMLQQVQPMTEEVRKARAFCLYRLGRALVYRGLPDVVAEKPVDDPDALEARLLGTYTQLKEMLAGRTRPEFVLLDVRMLRRDGWYGRALQLLESYGNSVDRQWLLKKRRDLLQELKWQSAYQEAANVYADAYPEEAARELKGE